MLLPQSLLLVNLNLRMRNLSSFPPLLYQRWESWPDISFTKYICSCGVFKPKWIIRLVWNLSVWNGTFMQFAAVIPCERHALCRRSISLSDTICLLGEVNRTSCFRARGKTNPWVMWSHDKTRHWSIEQLWINYVFERNWIRAIPTYVSESIPKTFWIWFDAKKLESIPLSPIQFKASIRMNPRSEWFRLKIRLTSIQAGSDSFGVNSWIDFQPICIERDSKHFLDYFGISKSFDLNSNPKLPTGNILFSHSKQN